MTELGKEVTGATSFIEKLSEAKYFFFIANLFFLADSCLVAFYNRNIFDLDFVIHSYISQSPVSRISMFVIAFLFMNHFLFFIARIAIIKFIILPFYIYIYIQYIQRDFSRPHDFRSISFVKFEAIRNHVEFTLKRVQQHEQAFFHMEQFSTEIFTFVCFCCINFWIVGSAETPTISQSLIYFLEANTESLVGRVLYGGFYAIVLLFIWMAVQGLIPRDEEMYFPRTEKKPSYPAAV
jgi:hypothetical protein